LPIRCDPCPRHDSQHPDSPAALVSTAIAIAKMKPPAADAPRAGTGGAVVNAERTTSRNQTLRKVTG